MKPIPQFPEYFATFENKNSKLNREEVLKIKKLINENKLSQYKIAKIFGVSRSCILNIKRGIVWKDVT